MYLHGVSCFQWSKDTNLKANHNPVFVSYLIGQAVSNAPKILTQRRITTSSIDLNLYPINCYQVL